MYKKLFIMFIVVSVCQYIDVYCGILTPEMAKAFLSRLLCVFLVLLVWCKWDGIK
ncbi:MAG: hypothetical protein M0P12_03050 [Paludibacteraceae bacterium]|nr:hypothetical protein [Paludibacteraceae bacterium]